MTEKAGKDDGRGMNSRGRHRMDVPDSPFGERVQDWILHHNVSLVHGPGEIIYDTDELVVLVLLRNGMTYLDMFVEHYSSLGAKHIVFLDNGSTDGTVEALRAYGNVTVLRTVLPYKKYNVAMKRYLIERFGRGRWTLSVDIDELFDYPYSDAVSLRSLLRYLNENSHTAVVAYMLDMFPEGALSEDLSTKGDSLKESHRFYDISEIRSQDYREVGDIGNTLTNEGINILKGGVQKRAFDISPLLIKHPLVFMDGEVRPMDLSDHWVANARIADFAGILLHYKISASLYGLVRREVEERRYISRGGKYDKYHDVLRESPDLVIKGDTAKKLENVNDLVGTRLVPVSQEYLRLVAAEERRQGTYSERGERDKLFRAFFNAQEEVAASGKRTGQLEQQIKVLRQEARAAGKEARRDKERAAREAQERMRSLEKRARVAEEQLESVRSSTSWTVAQRLVSLRDRLWRSK
jgi:glycosyltransferase involved in cell wall biosynthesis